VKAAVQIFGVNAAAWVATALVCSSASVFANDCSHSGCPFDPSTDQRPVASSQTLRTPSLGTWALPEVQNLCVGEALSLTATLAGAVQSGEIRWLCDGSVVGSTTVRLTGERRESWSGSWDASLGKAQGKGLTLGPVVLPAGKYSVRFSASQDKTCGDPLTSRSSKITFSVVDVGAVALSPAANGQLLAVATSSPAGKALTCLAWEKRERTGANAKWGVWTGVATTEATLSVAAPPGTGQVQYRARNGSKGAWKTSR